MKTTFTLNQLIVELQCVRDQGLGYKNVTIKYDVELEMYGLIIENHFLPICRNSNVKEDSGVPKAMIGLE